MAEQIDITEFARMIRAKRGNRGLRTIAEEIRGVSASTLSRIEQGKLPDLDTFIRICNWLEVSPDHFTSGNKRTADDNNPSTPDVVIAHLRADRTLDPITVEALVKMIQLAYGAIERGEIG